MSSGVVVCIRCGSSAVDIVKWVDNCAVMRCSHCGNRAATVGFTIGRVELTKQQHVDCLRDLALPHG